MVKSLILEKRYTELKKLLDTLNSVDVASILGDMISEELIIVFRLLDKDIAAEVFSHLDSEDKEYLLENITEGEIEDVLSCLYLDDVVDLVEEMPANIVKRILKNTSRSRRNSINRLLKYPEDSAGSLMTVEYLVLNKEMSLEEAIKKVKACGRESITINTCFIVDETRRLEGIITLSEMILGKDVEILKDIMDKKPIKVSTIDDREDVIKTFKSYDLNIVPVVDGEDRLVGIITVDDIIDALEEENTEDIQKMNALEPLEEEYKKSGIIYLAKHRIVWLFVLMISATLTGRVIGRYEDVLESTVILAAFIPMLMDTGGNAGAQASSLIIRGLALGELRKKDVLHIIYKEVRVGFLVGVSLATANFLRLVYFEGIDKMTSLVVCSTLVITVVLAKTIGGTLPILAKLLKVDPAIMAAPLITTIVDTISLIIYFYLATTFLSLG